MLDSSSPKYEVVPAISVFDTTTKTHKYSDSNIHNGKTKMDREALGFMGWTYLGAVTFAVIHHCFYQHWRDRPVSNEDQQKWVIRGGIAFAFGFKSMLAVAIGTAYIQYLWMSLRQRPYRADHINSMFAILANALKFSKMQIWLQVPLLAALALICWLVPIIAIVTPGTITVQPKLQYTSQTEFVPAPDFVSSANAYAVVSNDVDPLGTSVTFARTKDKLLQMAFTSALSGSIIPLRPLQSNMSYSLQFPAPGLACESLTDASKDLLMEMAQNSSMEQSTRLVSYFSWVPIGDYSDSLTADNVPPLNTTDFGDPINRGSETAPALYIFQWYRYGIDGDRRTMTQTRAPSLMKCTLRNYTYTADFNFTNFEQNIRINRGADLGPVILAHPTSRNTAGIRTPQEQFDRTYSYMAIMYAFSRVVTGSILIDPEHARYITHSTLIASTLLVPSLNLTTDEVLQHNLEELFQNITFSLFSSSEYLYKSNHTEDPARTLINIRKSENIYVYKALDLAISYSLALFIGVLCIAVGCIALFKNGGSYSNDFTTIMRTTRMPELDACMDSSDRDGANPLAKHIKHVYLHYQSTNSENAGFHLSDLQVNPEK